MEGNNVPDPALTATDSRIPLSTNRTGDVFHTPPLPHLIAGSLRSTKPVLRGCNKRSAQSSPSPRKGTSAATSPGVGRPSDSKQEATNPDEKTATFLE